jgi:histidinol-phosphatase
MGRLFELAYSTRGYGDFIHYHLLARGALEIVIESDLSIYDFAALTVIIREAGGTVTDLNGQELTLASKSILATNGPMHAEVRAMFGGARY